MTVINLRGLERELGGSEPLSRAEVTVMYVDAKGPRVTVDGEDVTFPGPIEFSIVLGEPDATVDLPATDGTVAALWRVRKDDYEQTGIQLARLTSIPEVGPIDFGDLELVDPKTLVPTEVPPTVQQLLARAEEILESVETVVGDQIAEEVNEYLQNNPPQSGFQHTQSVASASWVIPHSFGRLPSVALYIGGVECDADVAATNSSVSVTFATPVAGIAILT